MSKQKTLVKDPAKLFRDDSVRATFQTVRGQRQCHHRDAAGAPDCGLAIVAKRANLCPSHEREWQKAARLRYAARRAAQAVEDAPAPAPATSDDDDTLTARNQRALRATRAKS